MSIYGRIFAAVYDRMMASTEKDRLAAHRAAVVSPLVVGTALVSGGPVDVVDPVDALGVGLDVG